MSYDTHEGFEEENGWINNYISGGADKSYGYLYAPKVYPHLESLSVQMKKVKEKAEIFENTLKSFQVPKNEWVNIGITIGKLNNHAFTTNPHTHISWDKPPVKYVPGENCIF